jgi:hypothetical protein
MLEARCYFHVSGPATGFFVSLCDEDKTPFFEALKKYPVPRIIDMVTKGEDVAVQREGV